MSETFIVAGEENGSEHIFSITGDYQSKLSAPIEDSNAQFGSSVAVTEDLVVVGVPYARNC